MRRHPFRQPLDAWVKYTRFHIPTTTLPSIMPRKAASAALHSGPQTARLAVTSHAGGRYGSIYMQIPDLKPASASAPLRHIHFQVKHSKLEAYKI